MAKKAKAAKKPPAATGKKRGRPPGSGKKATAAKTPKAAAPQAGDGSEAAKPGEVLRMPSKKALTDLLRTVTSLAEQGAELNGSLREKIGYAKEHNHLHTKAFADVRKLLKMTPEKLNDYLAHFDYYADVLGLDALAESAPPLPLGPGPGEDTEEDDDETPSTPHGEVAATAPDLGKPQMLDDPPPRTLQSIPGGRAN